MICNILTTKIAGPGHPTEFTISYLGDKTALTKGSKEALGTYKYIGVIVGGSPIYAGGTDNEYWIAREFRGTEDKKIWKGRVTIFFNIFYVLTGKIVFIPPVTAP